MKVLITGINGMLGSVLAGILKEKHDVSGIDISGASTGAKPGSIHNVDLADFNNTYKTITKINPDIVIHTAALTDVDKCETDPDLAYKVNALSTRNVAICCQRFDATLLYISTDYVFSGQNAQKLENGYSEFDEVNPASVYAKSKYEGERYVKELLNKFFIVRTSWLYGKHRKNFITQIADSFKDNKTVNMAEDMISSPTYVNDLAAAISELINTSIFGLYHITNSGYASRLEVAKEVAAMLDTTGGNIRAVKIKELKLPAERPSFSAMDNYVWRLNGFKPLRKWQEAVKEFLRESGYLY